MSVPILRRAVASIPVVAFIVACSGDDGTPAGRPESAAGRIGFVVPSLAHHQVLTRELRESLKERDQEVVVQASELDVVRQQALVQSLASQKPRLLIVAPLDSTSLRGALGAASAARIPVFTVDIPVPGAGVTTHVEPDHYAAGVAAAEYLAAFLHGEAHSALLGSASAHGSRELEAGYRAGMRSRPGKVAAQVAESGGTRAGATAATLALLQADPDLDAIFAFDPESALGAMDAAFERRRADLVIVSFGATQPVLDAVREQRPLRAAIVPRPEETARQLAATIESQLKNEPVTPLLRIPVRLVNVDSVKTP